ncbi:hypothetical protein [Paraburkholderia phenoliruptrix]|uniref:hypothetical protein n=1 Tax=Paraburkholderia phenoliruptrix TaxID=252970 RepID=UPI0034CD7F2A
MSDKRWTYKQITDNAEAQIRSVIERASGRPDLEYLYREHARGIYEMWFTLCSGWIETTDIERLRALTDIPRPETANRS